jgi:hypothetical protein
MKRFVRLACVATLAMTTTACDSDSPSAPSSNPTVVILTANLTPGNEVPPVTNADAGARGTVRVTLDITRDGAGAITGGSVSFFITLTGFPAGTQLTGAHIHPGAAGVNGGVIVNTGLGATTSGNPLASGSGTFIFNAITGPTVTPTLLQQLMDNPGGFYFNVHTTLNTGGAIRAQLVREL